MYVLNNQSLDRKILETDPNLYQRPPKHLICQFRYNIGGEMHFYQESGEKNHLKRHHSPKNRQSKRKVASTGDRTHNHQVMSPTRSPLSHPGGALVGFGYFILFIVATGCPSERRPQKTVSCYGG